MSKQIEILLDTPFGDIIKALKNADEVIRNQGIVAKEEPSVCSVAAEAIKVLVTEAERWRQDSIILDFLDNRARFTNCSNGKSYWTFTLANSPRDPDNVGDWEDLRELAKRTMDEEVD